MSFKVDIPSTEDVLEAILSSSLPTLPAQEQHYASTQVSWWETDPGEVYIHAEGGTADDRHYASTLVALELQAHGYRRAQFDLDQDVSSTRTASWPDPSEYDKLASMSAIPPVLYHGTSHPDAITTGLEPREAPGAMSDDLSNGAAVYLTDDPDWAAEHGQYVYAINTTGLPIDLVDGPDGYDYLCLAPITPDRIKPLA